MNPAPILNTNVMVMYLKLESLHIKASRENWERKANANHYKYGNDRLRTNLRNAARNQEQPAIDDTKIISNHTLWIEDMAELRALISNLFAIVWLLFTFVRYFKFLFVHGC